ncbi:MAG: MBL fold metallo-hydrolase [Fidelibacterota bacterium]
MIIGPYHVYAVETGRFALDGGAMFGVVPKPLWEKRIPPDESNRIPLAARCLLLVGNDRKILVDTGTGDKWDAKLRSIYKIDTGSVNLERSLRGLEITPEDITDVWCTHLHFDHAGGNTRRDEAGNIVPTFPHARYWVQKSNWELANHPSEKDRASYLSQNWQALAENGMIHLVDGKEEFIPGVRLFIAQGHTAGQQLPRLSDGTRTLFFCGDLFPTAAHLTVPWVMAYDNHPLTTISEKKSLLPLIVDQGWILFFEHDPSREAVRVEYDGKKYRASETVSIQDL